jgi:hypothetical protein
MLLVGLDLKSTAVMAADPTVTCHPPAGAWWFLLSEHVGQPRFGLRFQPLSVRFWRYRRRVLERSTPRG